MTQALNMIGSFAGISGTSAFGEWRAKRRQRAELRHALELDSAALRDVGLTHGDIKRELRKLGG